MRDLCRVATTLGYGPRFQHSTGQLHKGGANNGVFIQLVADDQVDVPIPDEPYTFSVLKSAQALGDLAGARGAQAPRDSGKSWLGYWRRAGRAASGGRRRAACLVRLPS